MEDSRCYFDIKINNREIGRIIFELFKDKCPKTCENFKCLCTGERGLSRRSGGPLHYKNTPFHRVVKGFIIQGGDITDGNGKGGDSIYDGSFADENLSLTHDEPYLLSMANRGPDTNKSQFFITTEKSPHLDGKHVVFGRVVSGIEVIKKIENLEVDSKSRPLKEVIISDCGKLSEQDRVESRARERKISVTGPNAHNSAPRQRKSRSSSRSFYSSSSSGSRSSSNSSRYSGHHSSRKARSPSRGNKRSGSSSGSSSRGSSSGSSSGTSTSSTGSASCSSSRSSSSGSKSSVGSNSKLLRGTKTNPHDSDSSYSSNDERSRRRKRTNRRLEDTKNVSVKPDVDIIKKEESPEFDPLVNPNYKCSVKLDEIPEVPVNRFLLRGLPPSTKGRKRKSPSPDEQEYDSETPFQVDLSKFEDLPDDARVDGSKSSSTNVLRSQVRPTQPLVSKSGRIMKGRGTFRFRTPSPEDDDRRKYRRSPDRRDRSSHHRSDRSRSPIRYSRHAERRSGRDYRHSSRRD